ncbi:MAG: YbaN family protein [Alphaproteobacteria bacterium]
MRAVWFTAGLIALGLGILGVALPLLPTTPFVLLAAFAFARSSDSWHAWLCEHRVFGPIIDDWRRHGAIARRAKIAAVISMAGVFILSLALNVSAAVLAVQGIFLTGAAAFVLSRPSSGGR